MSGTNGLAGRGQPQQRLALPAVAQQRSACRRASRRRATVAVSAVVATEPRTATATPAAEREQQQRQNGATARPATPTISLEDAGALALPGSGAGVAVSSKLNAARELARRLSEEKQAGAVTKPQGAEASRNAEEANAAAAAQAARTGALAKALRKAESTREALQRIKEENESLKQLLEELAEEKEAARARGALLAEELANAPQLGLLTPLADNGAAAGGDAAFLGGAQAAGAWPQQLDLADASPLGGATWELGPQQQWEEEVQPVAQAPLYVVAEPQPWQQAAAPQQQQYEEEEEEEARQLPLQGAGDAEREAAAAAFALPAGLRDVQEEAAGAGAEAARWAAADAALLPAPPASEVALADPDWWQQPITPAAAAALEQLELQPPAAQEQEQQEEEQQAVEASALAVEVEAAVAAPAEVVVEEEEEEAPPEPEPEPEAPPEPAYVDPQALEQEQQLQRQQERRRLQMENITATVPQLQQLANMATQAGQNMFTLPPQPVPVDGPVRIFYNRARGPLPPKSQVVMKVGLNKWDLVTDVDMTPVDYLPQDQYQHWHEVTLELPAELFRVDFVIFDRRTETYDNNNAKDYKLDLSGAPTEQQLLEQRMEAMKTFEQQRLAYLEYENGLLWKAVEEEAQQAAAAARVVFRQQREVRLRADAQAQVDLKRKVEASGLPVRDFEPGIFAWTVVPSAGGRAFLAYNKGRGPLSNCGSVRLHVGHDGWAQKQKQTYDLLPMTSGEIETARLKEGVEGNHSWYGTWVQVPANGVVLDFVLSDRDERQWDNNYTLDYHTTVRGVASADEMRELIYLQLKQDTEQSDQVQEEVAAARAHARVLQRGQARQKRRSALHDFLFTVPFQPQAGQTVEVYYNPERTALKGSPAIFMRYGFNRWTYNQGHQGAQSVKLEPTLPNGMGFWVAQVEVPAGHVWGMDMVFVDTDNPKKAAEAFDNNGGLDYHTPVCQLDETGAPIPVGLTHTSAPLKVVHVAVEMAPIAKVGGMADVVTALGRAVQEEGHQVEVVVPKYDNLDYSHVEYLRQEGSIAFGGTTVRVWKGLVDGLPTTFLEPENGYFWRGTIYGCKDDHMRFNFHCGATLAYLAAYDVRPHVLHCHDWPTAPIAWGDRGTARCVLTIHNLSHGADQVGRAMAVCEVATTVSPTYAKEISGNNAVAQHLGKLFGIRNGIDTDAWSPSNDKYLPRPYGPDDAIEGKEAAKRELRRRLNLGQMNVPIISVVTRLVAQKGINLIKHAAWRTLERGGQFVLLGSAPDARVQAEFEALKEQLQMAYHDRAALVFSYDEPLSHLIYAGSDMFLVPSIFEPCGLTQMIAMQYGTVPVVRKTGGLADTVFDVEEDDGSAAAAGLEPNGFVFASADVAGIDDALTRAMNMWYTRNPQWRQLVSRVMRQDWSWYSPSLDYVELYYRAMRS